MGRRGRKPNRRRQCEGKHRHATLEEALAHIRMLAQQKRVVPKTMSAYRCPICGTYHVGHRPLKGRR